MERTTLEPQPRKEQTVRIVSPLRPATVIWEPTRACDLACRHCRSAVQPKRSAFELTTEEGYRLIDQIAELEPRAFVITGGDPLKRPEIFNFIEYASLRGLSPTMTPSATPLLTDEAIREMKYRRLAGLKVSLDGATASTHDGFRAIPGSFELTLHAIESARALGLPVQVNTTITRKAYAELEDLFSLLEELEVSRWNAFFVISSARGRSVDAMSAEEIESAFEILYRASATRSFAVTAIEAPQYRRFLLQKRLRELGIEGEGVDVARAAGIALGSLFSGQQVGPKSLDRIAPDGVSTDIFVSHLGEVYPGAFLPLSAGNARRRSLVDIYRTSPLFQTLQDPQQLEGKCGRCEYREICGGSRARAYAISGDPLAEDVTCAWEPRKAS
ncbi:MAG: TIGR04053 family radical SAM/SPASM domain-containing protein [Thermoanaerobaculia bacterium]